MHSKCVLFYDLYTVTDLLYTTNKMLAERKYSLYVTPI